MSMVPGGVGTASSFPDGLSVAGGITGVTNGGNATAGNVGQAVRSAATGVSAVSGQYADITSITLTAGDWDISAVASMTIGSAVMSGNRDIMIGTVAGNDTTGRVLGDNQQFITLVTGADGGGTIPSYRVNITGSTTYYLKARMTFTTATPTMDGRISARRVR